MRIHHQGILHKATHHSSLVMAILPRAAILPRVATLLSINSPHLSNRKVVACWKAVWLLSAVAACWMLASDERLEKKLCYWQHYMPSYRTVSSSLNNKNSDCFSCELI